MNKEQAKKRLEEIRKEIKKECISYGEIAELQSLVKYIDSGDVELLEWAGVKEKALSEKEDVESCISFAVKEGYLDEDTAEKMTWDEKVRYKDRCDSVEPYEETPW
jgi:hypothetical protein